MANRRSWELSQLAIALYILSLALPAISVIDKPMFGGSATTRMLLGGQCLLMGWVVWPGWVANPLFGLALLLHHFKKHGAAAVLLVFAIASAILGLVILRELDFMPLEHVQVGYFVWLASIVVLLIAVIRPPRFRATLEP
jgi:hypothetical protein